MGVQQDSWDLRDQALRGKGRSVRCVSAANAPPLETFSDPVEGTLRQNRKQQIQACSRFLPKLRRLKTGVQGYKDIRIWQAKIPEKSDPQRSEPSALPISPQGICWHGSHVRRGLDPRIQAERGCLKIKKLSRNLGFSGREAKLGNPGLPYRRDTIKHPP